MDTKTITLNFIVFCIIFSVQFESITGFGNKKTPVFLEYTLSLSSGQSDWYYQEAMPGSIFSLDLEVQKASFGGKVGISIKDPNEKVLVPYNYVSNSTFVTHDAIGGYYSFLIDNKFTFFTGAKVVISISNYYQDFDWPPFLVNMTGPTAEAQAIEQMTQNITAKLSNIRLKVTMMKNFMYLSRKMGRTDYALLDGNARMITNWSIIQCVVIIISGCLHVYFIRQFFKTPMPNKGNRRGGGFPSLNLPSRR